MHHVVAELITPHTTPVEERPPIPTADERLAKYKEKRFAKLERRTLRREAAKGTPSAIAELEDRGLDPGMGVEEGKGETANLETGTGKKRTPNKGAILGKKGQKLPHGVLPGGKEEVGPINERASKNKGRAMAFEKQIQENVQEAMVKEDELQARGLSGGSVIEGQGPYFRQATGEKGEPGRKGGQGARGKGGLKKGRK